MKSKPKKDAVEREPDQDTVGPPNMKEILSQTQLDVKLAAVEAALKVLVVDPETRSSLQVESTCALGAHHIIC